MDLRMGILRGGRRGYGGGRLSIPDCWEYGDRGVEDIVDGGEGDAGGQGDAGVEAAYCLCLVWGEEGEGEAFGLPVHQGHVVCPEEEEGVDFGAGEEEGLDFGAVEEEGEGEDSFPNFSNLPISPISELNLGNSRKENLGKLGNFTLHSFHFSFRDNTQCAPFHQIQNTKIAAFQ